MEFILGNILLCKFFHLLSVKKKNPIIAVWYGGTKV